MPGAKRHFILITRIHQLLNSGSFNYSTCSTNYWTCSTIYWTCSTNYWTHTDMKPLHDCLSSRQRPGAKRHFILITRIHQLLNSGSSNYLTCSTNYWTCSTNYWTHIETTSRVSIAKQRHTERMSSKTARLLSLPSSPLRLYLPSHSTKLSIKTQWRQGVSHYSLHKGEMRRKPTQQKGNGPACK